jgi:hypothetical protein
MKIKSKQKLRVIRYCNESHLTINCTYDKLADTLDTHTTSAVEEALKFILNDRSQYKGISATFNGINIQVNLVD